MKSAMRRWLAGGAGALGALTLLMAVPALADTQKKTMKVERHQGKTAYEKTLTVEDQDLIKTTLKKMNGVEKINTTEKTVWVQFDTRFVRINDMTISMKELGFTVDGREPDQNYPPRPDKPSPASPDTKKKGQSGKGKAGPK